MQQALKRSERQRHLGGHARRRANDEPSLAGIGSCRAKKRRLAQTRSTTNQRDATIIVNDATERPELLVAAEQSVIAEISLGVPVSIE